MVKWPARTTIEIGARFDPETSRWFFVIFGASRQVVRQSESIYESDEEAKAAARDWLVQTMLR